MPKEIEKLNGDIYRIYGVLSALNRYYQRLRIEYRENVWGPGV